MPIPALDDVDYVAAMALDPPVIVYADEACMVATWRSMVFPVMGYRTSTAVAATTQARAIETHGRSVGRGKLLEVSIVDAQTGIPDSEVRAAMDAMVPVVAPYYAAVGAIFEGDGFRSAMIRGVIASFQLLSRSKYPQRVFSNVADCGNWIAPYASDVGMRLRDANEMIDAISAVRAEAEARGILSTTRQAVAV